MNIKLIMTTFVTLLGIAGQAEDSAPSYTSPVSTTGSSYNELSGRFGVGLILGEPTGVSLKYFFNETIAIDGAVGWAFHHETDLYLHSDVLWHKFDLVSVPEGALPFYVGVGARLKMRDHDDDRVGVRVPFGVSYIFERLPLDVFAEVAPIIDFAPSTRGGFTIGIGARWWF